MTREDKELLLKDLCARLPYGVFVRASGDWYYDKNEAYDVNLTVQNDRRLARFKRGDCELKPYLRPMSSMTEEEKREINDIITEFGNRWFDAEDTDGHWSATFWESSEIVDYLNAHHFDYRGLIEKGLAIEAPEGMYKTE